MSTRPTPETDAAAFPCMTWPSQEHPMVVKADYARRLERERDEARFDLDFRRRLGDLQNQTINNLWDEAREQRDRLAEALRIIADLLIIADGTSCRECGGEDQALLAREALQSLTTNAELTHPESKP